MPMGSSSQAKTIVATVTAVMVLDYFFYSMSCSKMNAAQQPQYISNTAAASSSGLSIGRLGSENFKITTSPQLVPTNPSPPKAALGTRSTTRGGKLFFQTCTQYVAENDPGGHAHHWFTASNNRCLWNEDERFKPLPGLPKKSPSPPTCKIWYVGAHKHGHDGKSFQKQYNCEIHVFEPHPDFFNVLNAEYKREKIENAHMHDYGFGGSTRTIHNIGSNGVGSFNMVDGKGKTGKSMKIRAAAEIWKELIPGDGTLDLLHLNCEGCEYELMESLIKANLISKIKTIQIGTHKYKGIQNISSRYCNIVSVLTKTHKADFQQIFGWDRWERTNAIVDWSPPTRKCSHAFNAKRQFACCAPTRI
jgi:FkbM family methyltransferase